MTNFCLWVSVQIFCFHLSLLSAGHPRFNDNYKHNLHVSTYISSAGCRRKEDFFKLHLTPQFFFRSNKSLHLFETHCTFLPRFDPNLDFLQALKVMKSSHYLLHDRASKGYGSIPGLTSKTDLHRIKSF